MYKTFRVKNFRGFHDIELKNLARVNLVSGQNGIGKTALLEAFYLHAGAENPLLPVKIDAWRGLGAIDTVLGESMETPWDNLFFGFGDSDEIEVSGTDDVAGQRTYRLRVLTRQDEIQQASAYVSAQSSETEIRALSEQTYRILELNHITNDGSSIHYILLGPKGIGAGPMGGINPFNTHFHGVAQRPTAEELARQFGNLQKQGKEEVLVEMLRLIEPRMKRVVLRLIGEKPLLQADIDEIGLIPLPLMGDGALRLTAFVLHISATSKGVALIDEIENGIHHSVLTKVWRAIYSTAKLFDSQVISTTHSYEAISAAHNAFVSEDNYDFCVFRLERIKGMVEVVRYDREALDAAISDELEIR